MLKIFEGVKRGAEDVIKRHLFVRQIKMCQHCTAS